MIDKDLEVEIFRIEVRQKGNCLPRVYVYENGKPICVDRIEFTASALEIPSVIIAKSILKGDENYD